MNFGRFLIELVTAIVVSVIVSVTVSVSLFYVFTHPHEFSRFVHIPGLPGMPAESSMAMAPPASAPAPAPATATQPAATAPGETA